jgi:hypothetical protein
MATEDLFKGSKLSDNAMEMFDGPFFSDDGAHIPSQHSLGLDTNLYRQVPARASHTRPEDRGYTTPTYRRRTAELLPFVKRMPTWDPEERPTAAELLEDSSLDIFKDIFKDT